MQLTLEGIVIGWRQDSEMEVNIRIYEVNVFNSSIKLGHTKYGATIVKVPVVKDSPEDKHMEKLFRDQKILTFKTSIE